MRKKMMFLLTMVIVLFSSNLVQASTNRIGDGIQKATVENRKDDIEYIYRIQDGKLYKCLYNYSKNEWIGNWILCN